MALTIYNASTMILSTFDVVMITGEGILSSNCRQFTFTHTASDLALSLIHI